MMVRVRYWVCLLPPLAGIAVGVVEDLLKGTTRHLDNPYFWLPIIGFTLVVGGILWLLPWGKLRSDTFTGIDTIGRIRTIKWSDITRLKHQTFPGLTYFRLYTAASRFAVWLYIPRSMHTKVINYINSEAPTSLVAHELNRSGSN